MLRIPLASSSGERPSTRLVNPRTTAAPHDERAHGLDVELAQPARTLIRDPAAQFTAAFDAVLATPASPKDSIGWRALLGLPLRRLHSGLSETATVGAGRELAGAAQVPAGPR